MNKHLNKGSKSFKVFWRHNKNIVFPRNYAYARQCSVINTKFKSAVCFGVHNKMKEFYVQFIALDITYLWLYSEKKSFYSIWKEFFFLDYYLIRLAEAISTSKDRYYCCHSWPTKKMFHLQSTETAWNN